MPTLPEPSTVPSKVSSARAIAALTYYANPQNPALTTAQFVREFTPLLQRDAIMLNRYLVLMADGTIRARNPALFREWAALVLPV